MIYWLYDLSMREIDQPEFQGGSRYVNFSNYWWFINYWSGFAM